MSKKIYLKQHDTLKEWHEKIRRIRNKEHKLKMLVTEKIMANPNITGEEVQKIFFISPATMYCWIKQYNINGLEGLKNANEKQRGSGRGNKKVDDEVYLALKKAIANNSSKKWTGKEKVAYIKEQFGIEVSEQAVAYRMKKF
ncbi:MAG TPA: helix-turn-helix domain-containing protein [Arcobacter sp.]|nr:helix-turn-helix domain-containing protein [Arcobacter sp.]